MGLLGGVENRISGKIEWVGRGIGERERNREQAKRK